MSIRELNVNEIVEVAGGFYASAGVGAYTNSSNTWANVSGSIYTSTDYSSYAYASSGVTGTLYSGSATVYSNSYAST